MFKNIFIACLAIIVFSFSPSNFCEYSSKGLSNSNGLNIKIYAPCDWATSNKETQFDVINLKYSGLKELATAALIIADLGLNEKEGSALISTNGIKKLTKDRGNFVYSKLFNLKGIKGGQIIKNTVMPVENGTFYFYTVSNYFWYKNKIVNIQYTVGGRNNEFKKRYNSYIELFEIMLKKTEFN